MMLKGSTPEAWHLIHTKIDHPLQLKQMINCFLNSSDFVLKSECEVINTDFPFSSTHALSFSSELIIAVDKSAV